MSPPPQSKWAIAALTLRTVSACVLCIVLLLQASLQAQIPAPVQKSTSGQRGFDHFEIAPKTPPPRQAGNTYALVIGISRYKSDPPVTSLQFAHKDAESFAALLEAPIGGGLTQPDHIRLLTNEKATRAAIDDAVKDLANVHGTAENTLILFVAAHGVYLKTEEDPDSHKVIERSPYILTYESNPQDAKTTGYSMEEFRRMIAQQALHFGRVLVFLDVCHAANVAGIGGGNELDQVVRKVWEGGAGELGLMLASHAKKFAVESPGFGGGHGAFSYFVISGLNGSAASPGSNSITFANLAIYVVKNVGEFTRGQQTPVQNSTDEDMILVADTRREGVSLPPAQPMSESEVRQLRGRRTLAVGQDPGRPGVPAGDDPFDTALRRGALLAEEPDSASRLLETFRRAPNPSPATIRDRERRLRIALEDRGQEIMSRYLDGDEVPQIKADFDRCARYFEEALRLAPDSEFDRSRERFCRGRAQIFTGRYDDAQRFLDESIHIDPRRAYAYNALGISYLERIARTGKGFDEATKAFRTAMQFAPYWAYPVHNLALLSAERGDYDGAIRLYQSAMSIAPRYSYLPYNLGLLFERLGDFENAQLWFIKARETVERFGRHSGSRWAERARIWNALGTVARSQAHDGRALELFQKAVADNPEDQSANHNLGLLFAKRGNFRESDRLWLLNISRNPNFLPSRIAYAESLAKRHEAIAAIGQYERIVSEKPEYVGALEAVAKLYLQQDQPAQALAYLEKALSGSASNQELLELRGDVYFSLGQKDRARADWIQASQAAPNRVSKTRLSHKLRTLG